MESKLLKKYTDYLKYEKGLSGNSISSYVSDLQKLTKFLLKENKDFSAATARDIQAFLREENMKKISQRTRAREIAAFNQFYRFLVNNDEIQINPIQDMERPKLEKILPDFLSRNEIKILFQSFNENDPLEFRDKTMFELMYSSGLRISEAVNLKIHDLDTKNGFITILGKGDKKRIVPYGEIANELLDKYIGVIRPQLLKDENNAYLFISRKGGHLDRKSAWRILKKKIEKLNILKNITPHTLRHSFATHMMQNNADIRSVQELLGHMDISTTQIYTHMASNETREAHKMYHPRSGK